MALSNRQLAFFTDLADLYAPVEYTKTSKRVTSVGGQVDETADYSAVKCRIQPSNEQLVPGPIGRQDYDVMDTTDVIRVGIDQAIGANWYVQLKTVGHPEFGTWYIVQGDAKNLTFRANTRILYLKRAIRPPGVVAA